MSAYTAQVLVAIEYKELTLTWYPSSSPDTIGYDIYYCYGAATPTNYQKMNTDMVTGTSYVLSTAQSGQYWIVIRAWDNNNNYSDSDPFLITI